MKRTLALIIIVSACSSAPAPAPVAPKPAAVSAAALEDHAGDSTGTAIEVPADAPDGGVHFENDWMLNRFGPFQRRGGGTGVLNGRRYNVVKIELENGEEKTVYFDITENWQRD